MLKKIKTKNIQEKKPRIQKDPQGRSRTSLKYIKHWLRKDTVQEWKQCSKGVIQELRFPRRDGLSLGRLDTQR